MARNSTPAVPEKGMQVYGSDAGRLGDIRRIEGDFLVVDQGILRDDLYIPRSVVDRIDQQGRVVLTLSKDEVKSRGWTDPALGGAITVSGQPAEHRPDALNQVSTTATPGMDDVINVDTIEFDDRPDMDTNRTE
ncbi:MAG TPA: DUF2171 domain-containing protein [Thermomicrobiales bacterium]|nr:DUF2171 domain-containing protein [Thermomicrobiales bacterium]